MHPKRSSRQFQQRSIRQIGSQQDALNLFNILTSDELFDLVESNLPFHRERLFHPTETLSMFLAQALRPDRSCRQAVNEMLVNRVKAGMKPCSAYTGGYCKARQRLPVDLVSSLVKATGSLLGSAMPAHWQKQRRRLLVVDGTTTTLPDTPENQARYPQQVSQKAGLGFPICRIVAATCLSSGAVIEAAMGPYKGKGASEHTLLRSLLPNFHRGDMLIGDALYGSYFILSECLRRGIDILFEQNGARKLRTDFRKGQRLGREDHLIWLKKPAQRPYWMSEEQYHSEPDELMIRELRVKDKVLITTIKDPAQMTRNELKALYKSRWSVELDIRNIKTTLGMETLSCKTPEMAEKEMWVYLLAYNLIRLIMAQSAKLANILPRSLSFKHTLQLWLSWVTQTPGLIQEKEILELFEAISKVRVGNRAGRVEPRAVKRRPKPTPLLTRSRGEARELIRKHGHPPKQREWNRSAA